MKNDFCFSTLLSSILWIESIFPQYKNVGTGVINFPEVEHLNPAGTGTISPSVFVKLYRRDFITQIKDFFTFNE